MATARTEEERAMAREHGKAKEAEAKMELHDDKARHAGHKQDSKLAHHLNPLHTHGTTTTTTGGVSEYPAGGHPPGYIP
uniref:Late embryogenesis abundant protein n=1 Tax=Kalanchoe fedtschenkoi TaxID=63787 RepID=A0A7N0V724_KALFE